MKEAVEISAYSDPAPSLGMGAQLSRDARLRLVAAAGVLLVHSAYPPGHPLLAHAPAGVQAAEPLLFTVIVSFPVNAFILLSFLGLAPRLRSGVAPLQLVRAAARRLVPAHVFWALAFLATKAAAQRAIPSPRMLFEGIVLGRAAAHLYFTPVLLALTLAAPLLDRWARTPALAAMGGAGLALAALVLHVAGLDGSAWGGALAGLLGLSPFALAGLAFARAWGGVAPAPEQSQRIAPLAGALALISGLVLAHAVLAAAGGPLPFTPERWLANNVFALALPVLLLSVGGRVPSWVIRVAPYTLGVYLIHPFFITALRALEAHVPALYGREAEVVVLNAALAGLSSLAAVALLARTPMRRVVL